MGRTGTAAALVSLAFVGACAAPQTTEAGSEPGEEVTAVTEPGEEDLDGGEEANSGGEAVSVELPGLPVGGSGAEFTEPSTQCVDVNLSGEPLPAGVHVVITGFAVSPGFAVTGQPCDGAPPCLGAEIQPATGCQVAVAWAGEPPVETHTGQLGVSSASATCENVSLCEQAIAQLSQAEMQTVGLTVFPPQASDDGTTDGTDGSG